MPALKLLTVPAGRGVAWMRAGFRAFARQPLAWSALFGAFLFVVFVLLLVPAVGALLAVAALPLASLGFMVAGRHADRGAVVSPVAFVEPLRRGRPRTLALLQLGVAYALASALIVFVAGWADGGALEAAMAALSEGDADAATISARFSDPRVEFGAALRLGLTALLSVPFWHAPALVHWGGQGVAQSLFSSTLAVWRNKGAFVVYGLAWIVVVVGFAAAASVVFGLLGTPRLAAFALLPATLMFTTAFYASLWTTYAECFGSGDDADPGPPPSITTDTP